MIASASCRFFARATFSGVQMGSDEHAIRELVETWHTATHAGDVDQVLRLMSDDVVFLVPGRPPMRGKNEFAKGLRTLLEHHRISSSSEIQEITVFGDWAYCWNRLDVTVTPLQAGTAEPAHRPYIISPAQAVGWRMGDLPRRQHARARDWRSVIGGGSRIFAYRKLRRHRRLIIVVP